jgi:hypothetical protein
VIIIGGGMYLEHCQFPRWEHVYGSAGRAAAALAAHVTDVHVHTISSRQGQESKRSLAAVFGFGLDMVAHPADVRFDYIHPLAVPDIYPPLQTLDRSTQVLMQGKVALRFGMIEGTVVVDGQRVVYDPQNVDAPEPFHANGSTAADLAIVCNRREGRALTGKREPADIANALLAKHGASIVVVKCGSAGALVRARGVNTMVPSFATDRVFSIGSGDIFSAMFTLFWGVKRKPAVEAARLASLATARYCATQVLPIPKGFERAKDVKIDLHRRISRRPAKKVRYDVYLAGPFFSMSQRWLVDQARRALLDMGLKVFSPIHDAGGGLDVNVAHADLTALQQSRVLFGILDGLDPGTLFEFGYANSEGIPAVAFLDRPTAIDLKMITGTGTSILDDFASAIYRAAWAAGH